MNVPFQSISQWERDIRKPKFETLQRISSALGVHPGELMGLLDYGNNVWGPENVSSDLLEEIEIRKAQLSANKEELDKILRAEMEQEEQEAAILSVYRRLNKAGKEVAVDRVRELTEIPKYQREKPQDMPTTPTDGSKDAPQSESPTEEPQEGK